MVPARFLLFTSIGSALLAATLTSAAEPKKPRDAGKLYASFCAGCHGDNLEGGSAPALLGATWTHGGDDKSIAASIWDGRPSAGMPGFKTTVSESELRGLIVFIREQGGRAASRREPPPQPARDAVSTSQLHSYRVETAFADLRDPWSMAFLPGDRALITEKAGALRLVEAGVLHKEPIANTPTVDSGGQAGLFDVVPHPDFERNGWIYLAFADPQKDPSGKPVTMTSIVRGRLKDHTWTDQEVIFRAPIELFRRAGGVHYGGRLAFDKDHFLFFSIGDRGNQRDAQNLNVPNGKIHRIHEDGRIPSDNPFLKTPGALPSIWSYGVRNPQGLRIHPATGELWEHEHGPRGGDELNRIQRGLNYGWPTVTFGMNYDGTPITHETTRADVEPPATYWVPSIAPCGMAFYTGDTFPKWKNHLFVASLRAEELIRIRLDAGRVAEQEIVFKGIGRMRDVITGPDGHLYVLFNDRVSRLVPASR